MTAPMTCCGRWAGPSVQQGVTRGPLPTRAYHVHACSSQERRSACVHVAPAPRRRVEVSAAGWADVRETHIGVVFLLGDRAFKMKKPVTTGFLDFATPQQRLAACRREVELNRRPAPDVYLGVSSVSPPELPPYRSGDGAAVEHFVVMRRMPDDRRLSTLVRVAASVDNRLRALARCVAAFHAAARRGPEITVEGGREAP